MLLSEVTTLRLGGPCEDVVVAEDDETLVAAVAGADADGVPALLLSGGSNVVIADDGWPGRLVLVRTRGVSISGDEVAVAAGEPWDAFVAAMVAAGRGGVEALAGIPGTVGSTPVQNVGAYGQEVADTIVSVRVWDRQAGRLAELPADACGFAYRDSIFKRSPGRYVVLGTTFALPATGRSAPVRYAELARALGVEVGDTAPVDEVAAAVLRLRRGKGMVLDADDHDTWSAGSFFTNPIVPAHAVPDGAPSFPARPEPAPTSPASPQSAPGSPATPQSAPGSPQSAPGLPAAPQSAPGSPATPQSPQSAPGSPGAEQLVKTSAAWLIEHAGFGKGFAVAPGAPVSLSTKHTLALTNRGGARTSDLLELARTIRDGVADAYGIVLVPEPVLIGCSLD